MTKFTVQYVRQIECPIKGDWTDDIVKTPCNHEFDYCSLLEWLNRSDFGEAPCPLCRSAFTLEGLKFEDDEPFSFRDTAKRIGIWILEAREVFPLRKAAKRVWVNLLSFGGQLRVHCVEVIQDISDRPFITLSPVYVSLIPTAMGIFNKTVDSQKWLNCLRSQVLSGLTIVPAFILSENAYQIATRDPSLDVWTQRGIKMMMKVSQGAMIFGSLLLSISHYNGSRSSEEFGGSLIENGVLASSVVSFGFATKKHWDTRMSTKDFVKKWTPDLLCLGFILVMVYSFALTIFKD